MKKPNRAPRSLRIDNRGYPTSLELHKIYRVVPDEAAAADGDIRVVDESGEDYLYSADRLSRLSRRNREAFASPCTESRLTARSPRSHIRRNWSPLRRMPGRCRPSLARPPPSAVSSVRAPVPTSIQPWPNNSNFGGR